MQLGAPAQKRLYHRMYGRMIDKTQPHETNFLRTNQSSSFLRITFSDGNNVRNSIRFRTD